MNEVYWLKDDDEKPDPTEKAWFAILEDYGYRHTDEFDLIIADTVKRGYPDEQKFHAGCEITEVTVIPNVINLEDKLDKFTDHWSPKIIAEMNDYQFKLVKIQGEFVWHKHDETDEVFIVLDGEMSIAFRNGIVRIGKGEMVVVPKGIEHMPVAKKECKMMVIEPAGTLNTGDVGSGMTIDILDWV